MCRCWACATAVAGFLHIVNPVGNGQPFLKVCTVKVVGGAIFKTRGLYLNAHNFVTNSHIRLILMYNAILRSVVTGFLLKMATSDLPVTTEARRCAVVCHWNTQRLCVCVCRTICLPYHWYVYKCCYMSLHHSV